MATTNKKKKKKKKKANVMLEYELEDAKETLERNLGAIEANLKIVEEDLSFVKDQSVILEVSILFHQELFSCDFSYLFIYLFIYLERERENFPPFSTYLSLLLSLPFSLFLCLSLSLSSFTLPNFRSHFLPFFISSCSHIFYSLTSSTRTTLPSTLWQ